MNGVRALGLQRCALGLGLLIAPGRVAGVVGGTGSAPPSWIGRVLGGRLLAQGGAELVRPRRRVMLAGTVVDCLHATSMLVPIVLSPRYRRVALASAGEAALSAAAVALLLRSGRAR